MIPKNSKNDGRQVWLNVASGRYVVEGFINLDYNRYLILSYLPLFFLKIFLNNERIELVKKYWEARLKAGLKVFNCRKPLPFSPESVDHILCSHFIEHVSFNEAFAILKGFNQILKKGKTLHLIVPDIESRVSNYCNNIKDPEAANTLLDSLSLGRRGKAGFFVRLLELTGSYGAQHRWMYDKYSISAILQNCDFEIMESNESPSSFFRKDDVGQINLLARKI